MKGTAFFLLLLICSSVESQIISSIRFDGNKKSKEVFLRQNISIQEGDFYDSLKVQESIQLLKNTNLFFKVEANAIISKENISEIVFQLEEVITIFPIVANGGSSERLNFTLGVSDIHFRGLGQTVGIVYQYYDRHSIKAYQITPRHKNNLTGHEIFIGKYSTIEPLYFADGTTAPFNFDNYHISTAGFYWLNRFTAVKVGGMLMWERYKNRDVSVMSNEGTFAPGAGFSMFKYQIRAQLETKKIEYHYERRRGYQNLFHSEWIETKNYPGATFLKFSNELKYFEKFGDRHNIALKNTTAWATNNESPFSPFVIDDFINVRGIGNRIARGTAILSFNSEYLFTALRHKYFFAQFAGFVDLTYIRPPGAELEDILKESNTFSTAGLGIRIHSRKWYNTVFRVDYGVNLKDATHGGFVFGLGQYI